MRSLGLGVSLISFLLYGVLILRGAGVRLFRLYPFFYSYAIFIFCGSLSMYLVYWLDRREYSSAFWIYFLVTILAEFAVLVEISDQIFRPYPAIRSLGRALTVVIATGLGLIYMLPAIVWRTRGRSALFDFSLRASTTKAIILAVLFYVARHYGSQLGRNVGGLMLGFSIYVGMSVALLAAAKAFGSALFAQVLWVMAPLASAFCVLVWTVSLWELAPIPELGAVSPSVTGTSGAVALELNRFNRELSKLLYK
jgi:hypothetical protein